MGWIYPLGIHNAGIDGLVEKFGKKLLTMEMDGSMAAAEVVYEVRAFKNSCAALERNKSFEVFQKWKVGELKYDGD